LVYPSWEALYLTTTNNEVSETGYLISIFFSGVQDVMYMTESSTLDTIGLQYAPSWIDKLTACVAQLPGPSWAYYLGLWVIILLIQSVISWNEGAIPIGTLNLPQVFISGVIAFFLALFYYLDERAGVAMYILQPALTTSEEKFQQLYYKITTLPSLPAILASVVMLAMALLNELINETYYPEALLSFPTSAFTFRVFYLVAWFLFGVFMYHTIHQLRLINQIYTMYTRINLFRMKPLYAFSYLSALTAGSLAILIYGFLLVNPNVDIYHPGILVWVVVFLVSALVTFILPQLGMHRLQEAEQERCLDEAYLRLQATINVLHQGLDTGELENMEDLNFAIASLEIEINTLKKIRTWPWEPETLQILITALAFPLGLWVIQFIVERILVL
jgi:hypothetical protein